MAQHDMNIANQGFPATRADLNNALQALVSNSSGTSAPSTTFANQWWYDTTNNKMYIRNEANNAWIEVFTLDQTTNEWQLTTGVIQAKDSDGLALKTDDGTTRLFIKDSDGKIGLGTASPASALSVVEETSNTTTRSNQLLLQANSSGTTAVGFGQNIRYTGERADGAIQEMGLLGFAASVNSSSNLSSDFVVETATSGVSSEKLRVTHDGTVIVGSTVAENRLGQKFAITDAGTRGGMTINSFFNSSSGPIMDFQVSRNNTAGSHTVVQNADALGTLIFRGDDGDEFKDGGAIECQVDGSPSNDNMPARLVFFTCLNGGTMTEKMRLNNSGQLLIGGDTTTWLDSGTKQGLQVKGGGGGPYVIICKNGDVSGGAAQIKFLDGSNDICGTILSNATSNTTAYGTSSDYRLKENVADITNAIDTLKALSPKTYNFISDPDNTPENGFIAHELATVIPSAVTGEKDAMTEEVLYDEDVLYRESDEIPEGQEVGDVRFRAGDVKLPSRIDPQQVDYGRLTPILTAALQEAVAKIEALETRVAALEG